jgi:acyl-CoA synthetase (AMP-forming)/AMP-acid ligase II
MGNAPSSGKPSSLKGLITKMRGDDAASPDDDGGVIMKNVDVFYHCDECFEIIPSAGARMHCFECESWDACELCAKTTAHPHPLVVQASNPYAEAALVQAQPTPARALRKALHVYAHRPCVGVRAHTRDDGTDGMAFRWLTYSEVGTTVRAFGVGLRRLLREADTTGTNDDATGDDGQDGGRPCVLLMLDNSLEWLVADFALATHGLVSVVVHTALREEALAAVLRRTRPRAVILGRPEMDTLRRVPGALVAGWLRFAVVVEPAAAGGCVPRCAAAAAEPMPPSPPAPPPPPAAPPPVTPPLSASCPHCPAHSFADVLRAGAGAAPWKPDGDNEDDNDDNDDDDDDGGHHHHDCSGRASLAGITAGATAASAAASAAESAGGRSQAQLRASAVTVMHTSGSTGQPKSIPFSAKQWQQRVNTSSVGFSEQVQAAEVGPVPAGVGGDRRVVMHSSLAQAA